MNKQLRLTAILFILLSQLGCANSGGQRKLETLDDAIRNYSYALRWGRIDDAVAYHSNEEGSRAEIDVTIMKSIRVTGFATKARIINPEQTEATVTSELTYYNDQYATLRTMEYTQHWWYEPDTKKWYLDSEFPPFR